MNIPDFNEGRVGEAALVAGLLCQHEINIRGRDLFPDSTLRLTNTQMTLFNRQLIESRIELSRLTASRRRRRNRSTKPSACRYNDQINKPLPDYDRLPTNANRPTRNSSGLL
ncbi:MAG: hypothetical protein DWI00_05610 [Planctomycetota bacterium]|nr:MAG: hypothetical protein DWI00_05610 [Planctomycetota bacterium]